LFAVFFVNKTSFPVEKGFGFVCLLIFQSGIISRIFCFSAMDGATHAKARMAGSHFDPGNRAPKKAAAEISSQWQLSAWFLSIYRE